MLRIPKNVVQSHRSDTEAGRRSADHGEGIEKLYELVDSVVAEGGCKCYGGYTPEGVRTCPDCAENWLLIY